jgi:uncharacterized protein
MIIKYIKMKRNHILFFMLIWVCALNPTHHLYGQLYQNTFSPPDVVLSDGPFKHARDLNIQHLLQYDVDQLLAPYRKEAGLEPKAESYENWIGLDGHIGGHYLSAMAMNYAATGNAECKKRMDYMLAELEACQVANARNNPEWGVGYVGGVPHSKNIWPEFQKGNLDAFHRSWVPWYNLHKMYAGLRDAWLYGGNEEAKSMFLNFCDWGIQITSGFSDDEMEAMLGTEYGGMNEIYADAFEMTDDERYLTAAKRFSHKFLLEPMAAGHDNLDNLHANTQVPKAVGFQRIAEVTNDETYSKAGSFFWETVTKNRSLAFGGNSRREHFPAASACTDYVTDVEGPESCNTNNMLKLTEGLFRLNPEARYADYYERALFNHILSTQHPEHGGYVYFTPARPRHYRVYSAPNQGMWCCVGTGMENHGKYNEFIYTHQNNSLFLNLFIASELNWEEKGIQIRQETKFPLEEKTRLQVTDGSARFTLEIRYPEWVADGELKITLNGNDFPVKNTPSSYIPVERNWQKGDVIEIELPMQHRMEQLPNVPDYYAFMYGPILLAANAGTENLTGLVADDSRWGHIAHGERLPVDEAPVIIADDISEITENIKPVQDNPFTFNLSGLKMINAEEIMLETFFQIHDARYSVYWMVLSRSGYRAHLDSIARIEKEMLDLQKRTIDYVATGEQQPEADHSMETENSSSGNNWDEFYREARNGGFFSYRLNTNGEKNLALMVRYWGYEWGSRKFDIFIDDEKLVSEDTTGRWFQSAFQEVIYKIPDSMVQGKNLVQVKFQAHKGSTAGGVYYIRLLQQD